MGARIRHRRRRAGGAATLIVNGRTARLHLARIQLSLGWIAHICFLDADPNPAKSILIAGAPRSGTTWLAEMLNHANDYRVIYEPFNRNFVPLCRDFSGIQYLRPDDNNIRYLHPARAIFSGRIRGPWVDRHNRRRFAQRRLIKDVRSNLMLKWVRVHFPEMPIVFLVRHPCAVALSRVSINANDDVTQRVFFQQEALLADHLAPFAKEIGWIDTPFQRHIMIWCIQNLVPFAQLNKGDAYLAFYENLIVNPMEEFQKLFSFLKQPFDAAALEQRLGKPSATAFKKGRVATMPSADSIVGSWRKKLSADELAAARRITTLFGLDQIYGDECVPNVLAAENLLSTRHRVPSPSV